MTTQKLKHDKFFETVECQTSNIINKEHIIKVQLYNQEEEVKTLR